MVCPRCARENDADARFCARCGLEFAQVAAPAAETAEAFCYRHKKEPTNLRCGRCDRPICHRCAKLGPVGARCPDCAKQNIAFRPTAVVHEAKLGVRRFLGLGPWGIYGVLLILFLTFGLVRGCWHMVRPPAEPPAVEQPAQEP